MNSSTMPDRHKSRRKLLLIALFALSPIVASYVTYFWFTPDRRANYGELLETRRVPSLEGVGNDGSPFSLAALQGQWVLLVVTGDACDEPCRRALYATRQARTIQGREQDRVTRAWLMPTAVVVPSDVASAHPGLVIARVPAPSLASLPLMAGGAPTILIVDTRGNLVLRYAAEADIKRLAADLARLLRASQIGEAPRSGMIKYASRSTGGGRLTMRGAGLTTE